MLKHLMPTLRNTIQKTECWVNIVVWYSWYSNIVCTFARWEETDEELLLLFAITQISKKEVNVVNKIKTNIF